MTASIKVSFSNGRGQQLIGRLELPPNDAPHAFVLFAHCFTCGKDLRGAVEMTRALTLDGFGVLRFDFTGLGESEGTFAETTFSSTADDLVAAAQFLEAEHAAPQILIGHSLGGTAVIRAASRIPSATALVTIGAPFDAEHVTQHFGSAVIAIEEEGDAEVKIAGRAFRVSREFLRDVRTNHITDALNDLTQALLIMHAPTDQIVGIDNAAKLYTAARHPKSFVSLDGADHLLSNRRDAQYAARMLAVWASRYVPDAPGQSVHELVALEDVATRTGRTKYRTDVRVRRHGLVADEPAALGGTDLGPTPYDLLLSALGACTGMTLRMYADRKQWALDEVTVHLKHGKLHATDGQSPQNASARSDHIERVVDIRGALNDDQRARLLEIANMCPVHRTLERGVSVSTRALEAVANAD